MPEGYVLKVVAISDTHGMHDRLKLPGGSLLIHCGDATGHGSVEEVKQFVSWLGRQQHPNKIMIAGNHDKSWRTDREELEEYAKACGVTYLQDSTTVVKGFKIFGSPWTPRFGPWEFMEDRGAPLSKKWEPLLAQIDIDILVTHGPPAGVLDYVAGRITGDLPLLNAVALVRPAVHVFGHIHEGYGSIRHEAIKGTRFFNASICTGSYQPINAPTRFEI